MWLSNELETGYSLLSSYECLGLEDSATAFQPTFMQQRLKWPPEEFHAICPGSFRESDALHSSTVTDNEFYTPAACLSIANSSSTCCRQDSSGAESSVERCSEMGETEAGMPTRSQFSPRQKLQSHSDACGSKSVCLYPSDVVSCLADNTPSGNDAFYHTLQDVKLDVGWMKEEEEAEVGFVKKEHPLCPSLPRQYSGMERSWMNGCHVFTSSACPSNTLAPVSVSSPPEIPTAKVTLSAATVPVPSRKLTAEQNLIRKAKVARYLEKRKRRTWGHRIRYASRKAYAENRPRIKGRFAKQEEVDALKKQQASEKK